MAFLFYIWVYGFKVNAKIEFRSCIILEIDHKFCKHNVNALTRISFTSITIRIFAFIIIICS